MFQALVGLSTLKDPGHTAVNPAVQTNCLTLQFDPIKKKTHITKLVLLGTGGVIYI